MRLGRWLHSHRQNSAGETFKAMFAVPQSETLLAPWRAAVRKVFVVPPAEDKAYQAQVFMTPRRCEGTLFLRARRRCKLVIARGQTLWCLLSMQRGNLLSVNGYARASQIGPAATR